jgi:DNA helicase-2/ATP-dependent DNA helicase PcrA
MREFESSSDDKGVKAFLEELDLEIDAGEQGGLAPDLESGPEAIKVMTVHAAKGLEFKYVFIANLVDKRFPTIERKEAIAIPDALVKEILPVGDVHLEEERRLFYVAMTRAKEGLFLSWSPDYGGIRKKKPSLFLFETGLSNKILADNKEVAEKNSGSPIFKTNNQPAGTKISFKLPSYFSYTQLAAFNNCPYQYRFAHILRIPIKGKFNFSFGKTMHSALQKIFGLVIEKKGLGQGSLFIKSAGDNMGSSEETKEIYSPDISFNEILKLYDASWIDDWYDSKKQKEEYKKLGQEILKVFHDKYNRRWPDTIFLEKGFNVKITVNGELYTVRGVIDRIDEVDGKIKIIDYKTGRPKDKLSPEEKEQLFIYQLAVSDIFKQTVGSLAFYYLENNSEVEFLGNSDDLNNIKEKIIGTINEIKKGEFPAKPSQLCRFCDFFAICEFRQS